MLQLVFSLVLMISPIASFGHSFLPYFLLDPNYTNINHGSYGSAPKYVHDKLRQHQVQAELNPDRWFRLDVQIAMSSVRNRLSDYVNCDEQDLVIIDNASAGINSILKSLKLRPNETILYYNVAYGMVQLTLQYVSTELFTQEQLVQVELDYQSIQNTDLLLRKTQKVIDAHKKQIKLAVFDHISSTPAVLFDVKRMIQFFRSQQILTLVDGAHAVGAIPINLKQFDPDFYVSNAHKWLYTHRSACLLYVKKELQPFIHPIITSFGYLQSYQDEFFWLGTKDYSAYLTIGDALNFRDKIGGETKIYEYNHRLALNAGRLLAQMWNSSVLTGDTLISTMNNVQLPLAINTTDRMTEVYQRLIKEHNIFLPMFQFDHLFYCRISAQIYLDLTDFQHVGQLVLQSI